MWRQPTSTLIGSAMVNGSFGLVGTQIGPPAVRMLSYKKLVFCNMSTIRRQPVSSYDGNL
jgi:hypothetical protein